MIEKEVVEKLHLIDSLKEQVAVVLEPKITDISKVHEVAEYVETIVTEENTFLRKQIKMAVVVFLFSPEGFLYSGNRKNQKKIQGVLSREFGITASSFSHAKKNISKRYRRYGKFADKVDEVFEKVLFHFNL